MDSLHIAAHLGNNEFVKLLLKNGNSTAYVGNKEGLSRGCLDGKYLKTQNSELKTRDSET